MLGLPIERVFNKVIREDVGKYGGEKFLVMVDLATHYCQDSWIRIKTPNQIIKMVIERWVGVFGTSKKILSDNGLKFQNDDVRRITETLQI